MRAAAIFNEPEILTGKVCRLLIARAWCLCSFQIHYAHRDEIMSLSKIVDTYDISTNRSVAHFSKVRLNNLD